MIWALTLALAAGLGLILRHALALRQARAFLQQAKQETREVSRLSLDNPYPMIQAAQDGAVTFLNPAAFALFPGVREQGLAHPVLAGLHGTQGGLTDEIGFGTRIYHRTVMAAEAGGRAAWTVYCYDVTERSAYERNLEAARLEAEKANRARGDFLANMSHELRTPMNGIIGLSGLLAESLPEAAPREMAAAVHGSAQGLLVLLNDILDFSKIEAGELALENIPYDPAAVVRRVLALQKPVADRKGLALSFSADPAVPAFLAGDPGRLQQILNNLVSNALKFTEKGSVTLSLGGSRTAAGSFALTLAVADTGIGIPQAHQGRIFEKFQQADTATARKYGGTGLGLAITRDLARLMGGAITLDSVEGQGTTFTVSFTAPIAQAQADTAVAGLPEKINPHVRVLIADDHPVNRLFLREALAGMGLTEVREADSGRSAVEIFAQFHPDLVLMDCRMPDMDGFEATRRLREMESGASRSLVIAVTADATADAAAECAEAGMDDYVTKPVDRHKLHALIQRRLVTALPAPPQSPLAQHPATPVVSDEIPVIFDALQLNEHVGGNGALGRKIIGMFFENLRPDIANLQNSFHAGDFTAWEKTAHKLHGACAYTGAVALAEACDCAQFLNPQDAASMKDVHTRIMHETRRFCALFKEGAAQTETRPF